MHSLLWICTIFHPLHAAQQKTLALIVDALLEAQNVCLAELARKAACQTQGRMRYTLKRIWRFLHNNMFVVEAVPIIMHDMNR